MSARLCELTLVMTFVQRVIGDSPIYFRFEPQYLIVLICYFKRSGIVKALLVMWPELCKSCDSSNTSPLYSAAVQGHLEVVNAILDTDASSMQIVRKNGKTALHTAGRYGLLPIVKAFIQRDAGIVSIKDKKGQTALHMAAKGQDTAVIEELLLADYSVLDERDKKGNTAIHIATRKCRPQVPFHQLFRLLKSSPLLG